MSEAIELYNNATFTVVTDDRNPDKSEIWATQKEMAKAFGVNVPTVSKHIKDVLQSGELQEVAVVSKMETTASDGKKYKTNFYNLKMIIAVGEFDSRRNDEYRTMIRRAIRERSLPDYELSEFKTVIEADDIKGTKHTRDECTLLNMLNAGHIGVIPTIF